MNCWTEVRVNSVILTIKCIRFRDLEIRSLLHLSGWKAIPHFFLHSARRLMSSCSIRQSSWFVTGCSHPQIAFCLTRRSPVCHLWTSRRIVLEAECWWRGYCQRLHLQSILAVSGLWGKGKQESPGRVTSRSRSQPPTPRGREKVTQIDVKESLYLAVRGSLNAAVVQFHQQALVGAFRKSSMLR